MPFELQAVVGAVVILFIILLIQGGLNPIIHGLKWGLGSRDEPREPTRLQGRVGRVAANHLESMAMFVPLILVAHLAGVSNALTYWGAALYLGGRVAFAVVYMMGVPLLRSIVWSAGAVGTILIFVALLGSAILP